MRNVFSYVAALAALCALGGTSRAQTPANGPALPVREFHAFKATDRRSHVIEAMALGKSGGADVVYVLEAVQDLMVIAAAPNGAARSTKPSRARAFDGDFLLWKLDRAGHVLHKEFIQKMPGNNAHTSATILPLPAPDGGAIMVGEFDPDDSYDAQFSWYFLRIDRAGKANKMVLLERGGAFPGAVLLPDAKGVLLSGDDSREGQVWKVDLDGKPLWKKTYASKAVAGEDDTRVYATFRSIALTDDKGGFVVAGDLGTPEKFGPGRGTKVWLLRGDAAGAVLAGTTFPGYGPSVCAQANSRFIVLYGSFHGDHGDSDSSFWIRAIDPKLGMQWDRAIVCRSGIFMGGAPAIRFVPLGRGFVLAGSDQDLLTAGLVQGCKFYQYDAGGGIVARASVPITKEAFLHLHVDCDEDRAYVATQTSGTGPDEAREAAVFEISLKKVDK